MKDPIIVTVSPRGQVTIPSSARKKYSSGRYIFRENGNQFILEPVKVIIQPYPKSSSKNDPEGDFYLLAETSLGFWDSEEDVGNEDFYNNAPSI